MTRSTMNEHSGRNSVRLSSTSTTTRRSSSLSSGMVHFQSHRIPETAAMEFYDRASFVVSPSITTELNNNETKRNGSTREGTNSSESFVLHDEESYSISLDGPLPSLSSSNYDSSVSYSSCWRQFVLCLCFTKERRSHSSLQSQLMIPFGIVTVIAIGCIVVSSIATVIEDRDTILRVETETVDRLIHNKLSHSTHFMGDIVTQRQIQLEGALALIQTMTQERFMGYPNPDDSMVPFPNHLHSPDGDNISNATQNQYPWKATSLLPFPSQIVPNVNRLNAQEHLGVGVADAPRYEWYSLQERDTLSTASAVMKVGANVSTTAQAFRTIHHKASDYASPLLKSIFEYQTEIKSIAIHFVNDGYGGASVVFPACNPESPLPKEQKEDLIGCEWTRLPNPFDASRPILTSRQRENCKAVQENVLHSEFCRDQVLEPGEFRVEGPYREYDRWNIRVGKAIFDKSTGELIACTTMVIDAFSFGFIDLNMLDQTGSNTANEELRTLLINWEDFTVITSMTERWVLQSKTKVHARDLGLGLDDEFLTELRETFQRQYDENGTIMEIEVSHGNHYVSMYPSPPPEDEDEDHEDHDDHDDEDHEDHDDHDDEDHDDHDDEDHEDHDDEDDGDHDDHDDVALGTHGHGWHPHFLNVLTLSHDARDRHVGAVKQELRAQQRLVIRNILVVGGCTFVAILSLIYALSLVLTTPLLWMDAVGRQVLEAAGRAQDESSTSECSKDRWIDPAHKPWWYKISPRTEIKDLVEHFHYMVNQFSGQGTAKLFKHHLLEVKNPFVLFETFQPMYEQRRRQLADKGSPCCRAPADEGCIGEQRLHLGPNIHASEDDFDPLTDFLESSQGPNNSAQTKSGRRHRLFCSPLFWWITCSIGMVIICCLIGYSIYCISELERMSPALIGVTGDLYADLERSFLVPFAQLRAALFSEKYETGLRDLHVFNRFAGWLFAGAMTTRNNTFTEVSMVSEECKTYDPFVNKCPLAEQHLAKCDCRWDDPWDKQCHAFDGPTRQNQVLSFEGLREDAHPNGDRNYTTFPDVGSSPPTTQFWPNVESLPGANTSDPDSTYHRAKIAASLSVVQIPLYNYILEGEHHMERNWGTYLALEKDGSYSSFQGCNNFNAYYSWARYGRITKTLDKSLCPEGKFGLDPRCLEWYVKCRNKAFQTSKAPLIISPQKKVSPSAPVLPASASLPLVDTRTNEFIGETMVRIPEDAAFDIISAEKTPLGPESFHVLTRAGEDAPMKNVLIGPGYTYGEALLPLSSVLLPNDVCMEGSELHCENLQKVNEIADNMRNGGGPALVTFTRTSNETGDQETLSLTYAPVTVRSHRPVDPHDFSRGFTQHNSVLFSVALGQTEEGISQSFDSAEAALEDRFRRLITILVIVALVALTLLIPVSAWISVSVTIPVTRLCEVVANINRNDMASEFPVIPGGSSEVTQVQFTVERLLKLVRVANVAFFMGNLEKAYTTLHDALAVFSKVNNSKAIGVANNNLGNIMLTMYRAMKKTHSPTMGGFARGKIIRKGCDYFKTAIDMGEEALEAINEKEGFSTNSLIFMQQVSNRYFNRAVFLLTVRQDHPNPIEAEQQGMMDLETCKHMDREVVDNGDREGFKGEEAVHFELLMGRIKGLLLLMKRGYDDPWGIEDLFEEARIELFGAVDSLENPLFDIMEPAGQMQRLDSAMIEYHLLMASKAGNEEHQRSFHVRKASEIGIRMLVDDDYVIGEAALLALRALVELTSSAPNDFGAEDPSDVRSKLFQYRHTIGEVLSLAYSSKDVLRRECLNACRVGDVSMEVF